MTSSLRDRPRIKTVMGPHPPSTHVPDGVTAHARSSLIKRQPASNTVSSAKDGSKRRKLSSAFPSLPKREEKVVARHSVENRRSEGDAASDEDVQSDDDNDGSSADSDSDISDDAQEHENSSDGDHEQTEEMRPPHFFPDINGATELSQQREPSAPLSSASPSEASSNIPSNDPSAPSSLPVPSVPVTFASLGVCAPLVEACTALGWRTPTQIQIESLPHALAGRDIIGLAETGSGKTGAFGLPILQALLASPQPYFGLVLAPTRELAFQIAEQLEALGSGIGVKVVVLVGGVDMAPQAIALAKKPHIICATPGRIVDHLENTRGFSLRSLRCLVLDEADRLLNMDFEREIDALLSAIPRARHTSLFSATMTSKVAKLQRASLTNPVKVEVSRKYQVSGGLKQMYVFLPAYHKDVYLAYLCNDFHGQSIIVFTSTCEHTQHCTLVLRHLGFHAIPLHGKMTQPKRLGALNSFKAGAVSVLVATDVASRGLDIPSVDAVINYDIPQHSKDYIHRVGRTARAGRTGKSVTLVSQYDVELFQRIEALLGYRMGAMEGLDAAAVMLMKDRVGEAQRMAKLDMREMEERKKNRRGAGDDAFSAHADAGEEDVDTDARLGTRAGAIAKPTRGRGGRGGNRGRGRGRGRGRAHH